MLIQEKDLDPLCRLAEWQVTVVDGIVYFATVKRRTYGLDARTGKEVWTYPDGAFTPVVTDGKRLYVVGWGKLYAFSPRGRSHAAKTGS